MSYFYNSQRGTKATCGLHLDSCIIVRRKAISANSHLRFTTIMSLKATYDEQGYVIVPALVSSDDMPILKDACDRIVSRMRTGQWPYRRTVGKQFPPYGEGDTDSWGVQHVMHPELGEKAFVEWYTSDKLVVVVKELMGDDVEDDDLQMGRLPCEGSTVAYTICKTDDLRRSLNQSSLIY